MPAKHTFAFYDLRQDDKHFVYFYDTFPITGRSVQGF